MKLAISDQNNINVRDLEFENKVWKNKLEYLIHEIKIHIYHLESYHLELKNSLIEELLEESLKELNVCCDRAISLEKKVQIQEEEIPLYIKDFPINKFHELYKEHQALERAISRFYKESKDSIHGIRNSMTGIFAI